MNSAVARLGRFGVIDIGSNSVRFVVFDGQSRSPSYFFNEKVLCGLGRDIRVTGKLHPNGRIRALAALQRFQALSQEMNIKALSIVATAAVRDATDGPDFVAEVLAKTGLEMQVISGAEEAQLSAKGILLGWPNASGLVCDIGGASMELAQIADGKISTTETSPLGPMHLAGVSDDLECLDTEIDQRIDTLLAKFDQTQDQLFLVGGSWRAIAKLDMVLNDYPLHVLDSYSPDLSRFDETLGRIIDLPLEEAMSLTGTSQARLTLVPMAARVLRRLLRKINVGTVMVSAYGLREGLLYREMPDDIRAQDPLLSAAKAREAASSRFPAFGAELANWARSLFPNITPERDRLLEAACHLHDVAWRSHPDYRAEICFDNATRTDLGGLTHAGRMMLAMALQRRYKSWAKSEEFHAVRNLLCDEEVGFAQSLGLAMRLGALTAGPNADLLGRLHVSGDNLEWHLPKDAEILIGEVAQKRLGSLADAMGKVPTVMFD